MAKFDYLLHQEVAKNVAIDLSEVKESDAKNLAVLFRLYYTLEFAIGQVHADNNNNYYPNASFSLLRFLARLRSIQKLCGPGSSFLDVGCGLGNKVWIAQELGFDAYGIELNKKYAEIACAYVGPGRVLCQDGVTYPDYSKYDVIYFYNPMPSGELETAILNGARDGAIIYHAIQLQTKPSRSFVRLSRRVVRITDKAAARRREKPRTAEQLKHAIHQQHLPRKHLIP
jgi:protein-L-isoaspartate O-methyltransferase